MFLYQSVPQLKLSNHRGVTEIKISSSGHVISTWQPSLGNLSCSKAVFLSHLHLIIAYIILWFQIFVKTTLFLVHLLYMGQHISVFDEVLCGNFLLQIFSVIYVSLVYYY